MGKFTLPSEKLNVSVEDVIFLRFLVTFGIYLSYAFSENLIGNVFFCEMMAVLLGVVGDIPSFTLCISVQRLYRARVPVHSVIVILAEICLAPAE